MSKKAKNIIVLRHGQSFGNVDSSIYERVPDYRVELTPRGQEQASKAAEHLAREFGERPVGIFVSPFVRTIQTEARAAQKLNKKFVLEDCRIREREWGGRLQPYNRLSEMEKKDYGNFFYRYHGGESCADAAERAYSFKRDFIAKMEKKGAPDDFLLVSHGEFARVLGMVLTERSFREFESWSNMFNCNAYRFRYSSGGFEWIDGPEKSLEFSR
jgi:broad specificity phosphatase PhoE